MKKIISKIGTILLAFTVLFSSLSMGIDKHYCGDTLFSKAIFSSAQDCVMQQVTACPGHTTTEQYVQKESCCYNVHLVFEANDINQLALQSYTLKKQEVVVLLVNDYLFSLKQVNRYQKYYQYYSPPLIVQDIPVLIQSFLI